MTTSTIGLVFIEGYADWEFGFLSGSAAEWFGARPIALTPGAAPVVSIGGLKLSGQRGLTPEESPDLDAVAVIGSDGWAGASHPDVTPLLISVAERGGVVGGICAGTLALARAGLFEDRAHTSNGRAWILGHLPDYAGAERYRDVPHAVADGRLVSAPGSAPGTFASAFLNALYPDEKDQIAQMRRIFAGEYRTEGAPVAAGGEPQPRMACI
jgi:putative intracellular protease/amidase